MQIISFLYITTAIIAISACIPQIIQLVKVRRSDEFELSTWSVWLLTQVVTLAYVISIDNLLMVVVNAGWVSFYGLMVYLIIHYRLRPAPAEQAAEQQA